MAQSKTTIIPAADVPTADVPQIYGLIGKAMREIGAVGKDSINKTQGFKYRGIDAVYNALNPVMSKYGLFIVPEVIDERREERTNKGGTTLLYSILKIRFTMYAPDGSSISSVIIGEGMDTGDKATNKAMSIALKYAAFQIFMIPTEETAIDPDAESHEVAPKAAANPAEVNKVSSVPAVPALQGKINVVSENPVLTFLAKERNQLAEVRQLDKAENAALWNKQVEILKKAGEIPNKPLSTFTQDEAAEMVRKMYDNFDPTGTELKAAAE